MEEAVRKRGLVCAVNGKKKETKEKKKKRRKENPCLTSNNKNSL